MKFYIENLYFLILIPIIISFMYYSIRKFKNSSKNDFLILISRIIIFVQKRDVTEKDLSLKLFFDLYFGVFLIILIRCLLFFLVILKIIYKKRFLCCRLWEKSNDIFWKILGFDIFLFFHHKTLMQYKLSHHHF